jgi:hypothetical protein
VPLQRGLPPAGFAREVPVSFSLQVGDHLEPLLRLTRQARRSEVPLERHAELRREEALW